MGILRGVKVDRCLSMRKMQSKVVSCFPEPVFKDAIEVILDSEVICDPAPLLKVLCLAVKLQTHYKLLQKTCGWVIHINTSR